MLFKKTFAIKLLLARASLSLCAFAFEEQLLFEAISRPLVCVVISDKADSAEACFFAVFDPISRSERAAAADDLIGRRRCR